MTMNWMSVAMFQVTICMILIIFTNDCFGEELSNVVESTYRAPKLRSGQSSLTIHSTLPGSVTVVNAGSSEVQVVVTKRAATADALYDLIQLQIEETEDPSNLVVTIDKRQGDGFGPDQGDDKTGSGPISSGRVGPSVVTRGGLVLLLSLQWLICGQRSIMIVTLLMASVQGLGAIVDDQGVTLEVDVTVRVPDGFLFADIDIDIAAGNIRVPTLPAHTSDISCRANHTVCGGCCFGHGACTPMSCQCDEGYAHRHQCEIQVSNIVKLHTNPYDDAILTLKSPEGDNLKLAGSRTTDGQLEDITELILDGPEGEVKVDVRNSLPVSFSSIDGTIIDLDWSAKDKVVLKMRSNDIDTTTEVSLPESVVSGTSKRDVSRIKNKVRMKRATEYSFMDIAVNLKTCKLSDTNEPLEPEIWGEAYLVYDKHANPPSWRSTATFHGKKVPPHPMHPNPEDPYLHRYALRVLTQPPDPTPQELRDLCAGIGDVLDNICAVLSLTAQVNNKYNNIICIRLGAAVSSRAGWLIGSAFEVLCTIGFKAIELSCDSVLKKVQSDTGEKVSLYDVGCDSMQAELDAYMNEGYDMKLRVHARYAGKESQTDWQIVNVKPTNRYFFALQIMHPIYMRCSTPGEQGSGSVTLWGSCGMKNGTIAWTFTGNAGDESVAESPDESGEINIYSPHRMHVGRSMDNRYNKGDNYFLLTADYSDPSGQRGHFECSYAIYCTSAWQTSCTTESLP